MEDIILPSSVSNIDFINVFDKMVRDRYNQIDLSSLMTYLIDLTPSANLYWLAEQFDVLSAGEFDLCDNEDQQRALIKNAIAIHRIMGTPDAIKNALLACGFANVLIYEGIAPANYDGTYEYNGAITYGGSDTSWATFRLQILDLGETKGWDTETQQLVLQVVNKYKRAVCTLVGIYLYATVSDIEVESEDFLINGIFTEVDTMQNFGIEYDGEFEYDGSQTYGNNTEVLLFNITPLLDTVPPPDLFLSNYPGFVTTSGFVITNPYEMELVETASARYPFNFVNGVAYTISFYGGSIDGLGTMTFFIYDADGDILFEQDCSNFQFYSFDLTIYESGYYIGFSYRTSHISNGFVFDLEIKQDATNGLDILSIDDSNFSINIVPSDAPTIENESGGDIENESGNPIQSE